MGKQEISVFQYTDYRLYLNDYYQEQKRSNSAFSYRYFARRVGTTSVGFYKDIISGKRNLGRSLIVRFSKAMKHSKREAEYFENMVLFNEAKTLEEKKIYFERMMASYQSKAFKIDSDKYELFSKWYYLAIHQVLSYFRFKDDCKALAKMVDPAIRPEQAESAIRLLRRLEFIKPDKDGFLKPVEPVMTTGPEVQSIIIANYHRTMLQMAAEAMDRHDRNVRDISALALCLDEETFKNIKGEMDAFRKKLLNMASNVKVSDRVYQVNYQAFPISRLPEAKKS